MKCVLPIATVAFTVMLASPAVAGTYEVRACSGGLGNASWAAEAPSGYVTAYSACPGDGMVTRMSGGAGRAPYGAGGRHVFTPPPGTRVQRFRGNVRPPSPDEHA